MPGHIREQDARGFALAPGKMVRTGGGGVLDIARRHVGDIPV
jgi:hypothetical protein